MLRYQFSGFTFLLSLSMQALFVVALKCLHLQQTARHANPLRRAAQKAGMTSLPKKQAGRRVSKPECPVPQLTR